MYKEHPVFIKPSSENIKIWRFIDFTKYVSLLETKSLYFNRADLFNDIFEATYPKITIDAINRDASIPPKVKPVLLQGLEVFEKYHVKANFLNCWHMNEYESEAMWKLYTNGSQAVAIQTTFDKLAKCFENNTPDIYIGQVTYIDYNKTIFPLGNTLYPYVHKRISYQHEQELRALVSQYPEKFDLQSFENITTRGINVKVDLGILIENIYVAPQAPEWFKNLIKSVTSKYNIQKPIESSSLDERPLFR